MKNFRIDFVYDGYPFWDVVRAENAEQAIAYFTSLDADRLHCVASETVEDANYTVPAGWTRLQNSEFKPWMAEAGARSVEEWIAYSDFVHYIESAWFAKCMRETSDDVDPEDFPPCPYIPSIDDLRSAGFDFLNGIS